MVKSAAGIDQAVQSLGGYSQGLYAEKWVPFSKVGNHPNPSFSIPKKSVMQKSYKMGE